jgi:hypothetical protein
MRIFHKFLCFVILTSAANAGLAKTINVACDENAISNAVLHTAQEGDTVLIGPGDCTFTREIDIDRNISFTIAGSGTNQTTLRSVASRQQFFIFSNSKNVFTIRDLNCVGSSLNSGGYFVCGWGGKSNPGPYHFYNIKMTNILYRGISVGRGMAYGLIDHCTFISQAGNPQAIDFQGEAYSSWTNSNPIGTTNVVCVEDCYFDNSTNHGNGFFDSYNGAQIVFRHNFCNGSAPSGGHGYDSQQTSTRTWEIYDNVFTNGISTVLALGFRGGTGVVYDNQIYGYGDFVQLQYYRSCASIVQAVTDTFTVPGQGKAITFNSNPINNQTIGIGLTTYGFVTNYTDGKYNVYGGGYVVIGATLAQTITNLYNCINLGPGAGKVYGVTAKIGHDLIAIGCSASSLILTNALDGNTDQFGYPANQQQGVLTSFPLTSANFVNHQVLLPCYAWGNTLNGAVSGFGLSYDTDACNHNITNLVKLNRDYFNDTIPTNYTPLVYPHPLQALEGGGGSNLAQLRPPTGLKVVPRS